MDKQKQIEEMAKTLCENCRKDGYSCSLYSSDDDWVCVQERERAEFFYNAGYRKIPEDAVVLTKEEHNKLRAGNYNLESLYKQYPYRVLVGFNSMVFSQDHENYEKLFDDIEKRIAEGIRKETAEKFAEQTPEKITKFLEEKLKHDDFVNGKTALIEFTVAIAKHIADEICKEITEGVK